MEATDDSIDFLFGIDYARRECLNQVIKNDLQLAGLRRQFLDRSIWFQTGCQHLAGFFIQVRRGDIYRFFLAQLLTGQPLHLVGIKFVKIILQSNHTNLFEKG